MPSSSSRIEKAKPYLDIVNESTESFFQRRQLLTVYKFARGLPQLVVNDYRRQKTSIQPDTKKRKFVLSEGEMIGAISCS